MFVATHIKGVFLSSREEVLRPASIFFLICGLAPVLAEGNDKYQTSGANGV